MVREFYVEMVAGGYPSPTYRFSERILLNCNADGERGDDDDYDFCSIETQAEARALRLAKSEYPGLRVSVVSCVEIGASP